MKLLLDTHVFIWYINDDSRLPQKWREVIADRGNYVYLSVVSIWEAVIKATLGKLQLRSQSNSYLSKQRQLHLIAELPLNEACVNHLASLPLLHRDPFDRILICQALEHDLTIMTIDAEIKKYAVTCLEL